MQEFLVGWEEQLQRFDTDWIRLNAPAPKEAVAEAEHQLQVSLSPQHKAFLRMHNGAPMLLEFKLYGVQLPGVRRIPKGKDLVHMTLWWRTFQFWPLSWVHIGSDPYGNLYVSDCSRANNAGEYKVLWVDHETIEEDRALYYAASYFTFLDRIVDEMLAIYNQDGSRKELPDDDMGLF